MSWDIYGEPLRRGHCEVHPHVHEEYPCSVCISEKQARDQAQAGCRGGCEAEHNLHLAQEHIEHLKERIEQLSWVPISERLPELRQPVVLININRLENTGGDWERHMQAASYLSSWGDGGPRYWALGVGLSASLEYFTHWMPLPAAPVTDGEGQA